MNKKNRKQTSILAILGVVAIAAYIIVTDVVVPTLGIVSDFEREYPTGAVDNELVYRIDSETIFSSLDQNKGSIFTPISSDSETNTLSYSGETYFGTENDFDKIANALHQFVWNESLENWQLYSTHYRRFQCQDDVSGFEAASFIFFQQDEKSYYVHAVWINLFQQQVGAGSTSYDYTGKWKSIDLSQVEVKSASSALAISETNGGRESRLKSVNGCSVDILLAPYAFEHNYFIRPFGYRDWGWNIGYTDDDFEVFFEIIIDPYTGSYVISEGN